MKHRRALLLVAGCLLAAVDFTSGGAPPQIQVIPAVKQVTFEEGVFEIDEQTILLVSGEATDGTRFAARAAQLALRERYGIDLPIVRIAEQPRLGSRKAIWIVEPRFLRPPESTIGVKGLTFSKEMAHEGYFIRVDMVEVVVHGTTDAASYYGVQTLLQLIRPPRPGSLFLRRRGPAIPCLWLADWPSSPQRALPLGFTVPREPEAAGDFMKTMARYKLNALPKAALPADEAAARSICDAAAPRYVRIVESARPFPDTPLGHLARSWAGRPATVPFALAALGEEAWGPPDPDPETLRRASERLSR